MPEISGVAFLPCRWLGRLPLEVSSTSLKPMLATGTTWEDYQWKEDGGGTAQDLSIYRVKYNQKLDVLTEANLVFSFL